MTSTIKDKLNMLLTNLEGKLDPLTEVLVLSILEQQEEIITLKRSVSQMRRALTDSTLHLGDVRLT